MKLGWTVVCGPPSFRDPALARLEMIADTYLSVGTPVQRALPRLFEIGREIHAAIAQRTAGNLSWLKEAVGRSPAAQLLGVEGGWSAVLRLPATRSEEDWCIGLASEEGVFVQPGWFFDFDREVHLVSVCSRRSPSSVRRRILERVVETHAPLTS
jgi:aspartate/methionine/tyrosine aminotransferase